MRPMALRQKAFDTRLACFFVVSIISLHVEEPTCLQPIYGRIRDRVSHAQDVTLNRRELVRRLLDVLLLAVDSGYKVSMNISE